MEAMVQTGKVLRSAIVLLLLTGCGGEATAPLPSGTVDDRIASALATIGFAVASADQGASFFDNNFPCIRRGLATFVNNATGRDVTFKGCEAAPGIVLVGTGRIEWVGSGLAPARDTFCQELLAGVSCLPAFRWAGFLRVVVDDTAEVDLNAFTVSAIVERTRPSPPWPGLRSWRFDAGAGEIAGADSLAFERLLDSSGVTMATLPNPSGSLATLSDDDMARLAQHFGMLFSLFLINEMDAAGGGSHTHTMPCGTAAVSYDAQLLPVVQNAWTGCGYAGLVIDGNFSMKWGLFDVQTSALSSIRMDLAGNFRIGGAVPVASLTSLKWTVTSIPSAFPGTIDITLELTGSGGTRTWHTTQVVDD